MLLLSLLGRGTEKHWKRKVSVVSFGCHTSVASGTMYGLGETQFRDNQGLLT